ncbi:MAG: hypothetical protein Tp170SUR191951_78 [Prokaryotic dsDNA virus sp.]|nr:MAG: hypothetical protein Tp170SUR191951_78 [Prokaryotic dsDNA virus sp.]
MDHWSLNRHPEAIAALRALHDVGVVRAEWNHPGYEVLRHRNLIAWRAASTTARDYRLTPRGRELAKDLFG